MKRERASFINASVSRYWSFPEILTCFTLILIGIVPSNAASFSEIDVVYFQDSTNQLTIKEVSANLFTSRFKKSSALNFGLSLSTCWLKIDVKGRKADAGRLYLEVGYPALDSVVFYASTKGGWVEQKAGDKILAQQKKLNYRKPLFLLPLADTLVHTYYLKVRTEGALLVPLKLYDEVHIVTAITRSEFTEGLFYGAMILMVLYNLFLFFSLKEKAYLYYCLFAICNTFIIATLEGQVAYYNWFFGSYYDKIIVSVFFANLFWGVLFTKSFLKTRYFVPNFHIILNGLTILSGSLFLLAYVVSYHVSIVFVAFICATVPITIWLTTFFTLKKGNTSARLFIIAWTFYLLSVTLVSLRNIGWITDIPYIEEAIQIASSIEVLLFSFALADRINLYRSDKIKAQQRSLRVSLENEQIVRNQNLVLEERIIERTQEISDQNEELLSQQEIIEELNHLLIQYSEGLEEEITRRTNEITKANKRLVQQNSSLEQFASIVSHKLRGPIAQILGLVGILDNTKLTNHNNQCLTHLEEAAERLDTVIRDLNETLVYRNISENESENISIKEVVQNVLNKKEPELLNAHVLVRNQVALDVEVRAIKPYLESALEHLVSNAIKFRSEERCLEITFSFRQQEDQIILSIADNGIGIDLEKYQDKIFGLYQRFHLHQEGKGVGLYLVRTQVEMMEGHIEVSSAVGKGTVFDLYLNASTSTTDQNAIYKKKPSLSE
uniref:histidine kinase n=1 Tax=Roseihalotalea indica TaxID=2867963 RepID=A0AA49JGX9_9BACT|nr:sensor histidine kinase [Tunicatimonas sp. TK19036]